ncbi:GNAT family N-acetyltransferase [Propionicicella superfundia]|uniref:GNAT family N-acetyltransferase n=1 Tax=Propionicicella superfundia TaxID=348582 RepID=UPI000684E878|nr:GNAT family protein [Propionicicella superfundia]
MRFVSPVVLGGARVRLDPLTPADAPGLAAVLRDGELWNLWYALNPHPGRIDAFVARRLADQDAGSWVPFVVRALPRGTGSPIPGRDLSHLVTDDLGTIVGLTNYLNPVETDRHVEIGGTWYAAAAQRSAVNTECKLLLLAHAFEDLGCVRVELRTHHANERSQTAIARIGATREGVLRRHKLMPDGSFRDTVVFSVLDSEWPDVRDRLRARLARGAGGPARGDRDRPDRVQPA